LTLAYEGTHFAGWQRQKKGRTVQATLEEALSQIFQRKIQVAGSSRTDSGVHAQGQVASCQIPAALSLPALTRALNALLPEDLVVRSIRKVPKDFHARFSACSKSYRYTLLNQKTRPLFDRGRVVHVPVPLNLKAMRTAARCFTGRHDFKAFQSSGSSAASSTRRLTRFSIKSQGPKILIEAQGNGFLYHMVRRMVGLLIEVGKGRFPPTTAADLLKGKLGAIAPTAPAKGLCLVRVSYPRNLS
jgi:tRNA pseudouridine38-40 synthase